MIQFDTFDCLNVCGFKCWCDACECKSILSNGEISGKQLNQFIIVHVTHYHYVDKIIIIGGKKNRREK